MVTNLFVSLENKHLLPKGPHKTAIFPPAIEVLKIFEEYLFILSCINFCGFDTKAKDSPIIGNPVFPGGSFLLFVWEIISVRIRRNNVVKTTINKKIELMA